MVRALTLRGSELTEQIRVRLAAFQAQELLVSHRHDSSARIDGFEMLRGL